MTLVDALPVAPGSGALIVSVDELFQQDEPNAVLSWLEAGKLTSIPVEWNACSVDIRQIHPYPQAIYLGEAGQLVQFDGQDFHELPSIEGVEQQGPLRSIRSIGMDFTLAVGTVLQVYRSRDWTLWEAETIPLLPGEQAVDLAVEAVAAFSSDELYAVGWQGLLCRRTAVGWERLNAPTNLDLFDLVCAEDGSAYAVGDEGIILKGRGDTWALIEQDKTCEKLWGVASFAGRVFVSDMRLLYEIVDNDLIPLSPPDDEVFPSSTYRLKTTEGVLWSAGGKELFEFDGQRWKPLLSFFDRG
ncbi:hypothetical protein [Pseudomonas chlororaphis]|uniref:hypothetical protein n=1 Tax=Pseudomonas chlororaphis TaxID=587753 RepID=UPI000471C592|nr:hypothetical protein [Pseudomonas chlororaphis]